jgi:hypothetical protein
MYKIGDAALSFSKALADINGERVSWTRESDPNERQDENTGYSRPNSEKYQSGMSVEDTSPMDMTGFLRTADEKKLGNWPITF